MLKMNREQWSRPLGIGFEWPHGDYTPIKVTHNRMSAGTTEGFEYAMRILGIEIPL